MVDADELARLLADTVLGGRALEPHGSTLVVRIESEEVWPAWQAARAVVESSGRWPVAITSLEDPGELGTDFDVLRASSPHTLAIRDPWREFSAGAAWGLTGSTAPVTWEDVQSNVDRPLSEAELRTFVERGAPREEVERAELDRWTTAGTDRTAALAYLTDRQRVWFDPAGWHTGLAFLPTADPVAAAGWLSYYGVGDKPAGTLSAVIRLWHEAYGAQVVAAWGMMLDFVVTRRPATVDEAWELAGQMLLVGGSLQCPRVDLTMALVRTDLWHLHDRP